MQVHSVCCHFLALEIWLTFGRFQNHETHIWVFEGEKHVMQELLWLHWLVNGWNHAPYCYLINQKCCAKTKYLIVNCDDVMTIDNQSWCSVHIYVINNFKRIPLLLNVEKVLVRGFMNNFITLILKSLMEYGGLIVEHVANKVSIVV
jgi:hypothetical protein